MRGVTLATALGCGAVGGVFFAFSSFVMDGLRRLPAPQGVAAMQSINVTAVRPLFMTLLFGTAAGCLALAVHAARHWGPRPAVLLAVGSGLYLLGAIGVTVAGNVPLNDALAVLDPQSPAAAARWSGWVTEWTRLNSVRTVCSLAAAAALVLALPDLRPSPAPRAPAEASALPAR